jgi:hypothetical protein
MYEVPTAQVIRFLGCPAGAKGRAEGPEPDLETPVIDGQPILGLSAGPAGWLIAAFPGYAPVRSVLASRYVSGAGIRAAPRAVDLSRLRRSESRR